ncbi:hypothetical protein RJ641_034629 [Dillenia turbinata]|uniref:Phytocyanin domain-containing protein n=1 Tax=Dillenia turbinata TaxID=194707 RepID=A0AAN8VML0_9MAGN
MVKKWRVDTDEATAGRSWSLFFSTHIRHQCDVKVEEMGQREWRSGQYLVIVIAIVVSVSEGVEAYKNYTVGDPLAVPLVKEGMNYFFSGDYDGDQCKHGQHFKINVTYGRGLPESLKNPADKSPAPTSPDPGDDESARTPWFLLISIILNKMLVILKSHLVQL